MTENLSENLSEGQKVLKFLMGCGFSISEISKIVRADKRTVKKWITGEADPSPVGLNRLMNIKRGIETYFLRDVMSADLLWTVKRLRGKNFTKYSILSFLAKHRGEKCIKIITEEMIGKRSKKRKKFSQGKEVKEMAFLIYEDEIRGLYDRTIKPENIIRPERIVLITWTGEDAIRLLEKKEAYVDDMVDFVFSVEDTLSEFTCSSCVSDAVDYVLEEMQRREKEAIKDE